TSTVDRTTHGGAAAHEPAIHPAAGTVRRARPSERTDGGALGPRGGPRRTAGPARGLYAAQRGDLPGRPGTLGRGGEDHHLGVRIARGGAGEPARDTGDGPRLRGTRAARVGAGTG